jgi:hypothetical protein
MTRSNTQLDNLITRLQRAGYDKRHIRSALPSWWTPEAEKEPGALIELKASLARRLGLELSSLLNDQAELRIAVPRNTKYKLRREADSELLKPATGSLAAVAAVVCGATNHLPAPQDFNDAISARLEILDSGAHWLSFKALVLWSWRKGIPVIPVVDLPGKRSLDAATNFSGSRPVVILTKNHPVSAWQLFFLSHELGHIASGHVRPHETLIDEDLGQDWPASSERDSEERLADRWARLLLAGADKIRFEITGHLSPNGLARAAQEQARISHTDAGHLILRFAFETKNWPLANAALRVLEPEARALDFAREVARDSLDLDALADDAREFLEQAAGV